MNTAIWRTLEPAPRNARTPDKNTVSARMGPLAPPLELSVGETTPRAREQAEQTRAEQDHQAELRLHGHPIALAAFPPDREQVAFPPSQGALPDDIVTGYDAVLDQVTIWLRPDDAAALQPAAGRRAPGDAMVDWVVGHASRHLRSLVELGTLLRALEPGPGGTQLVADLLLNREVVLEFLAGLASDGFPVGPNVEVVLGAIRDILSNEGAPGPRDLIARIRERLGRDLCRALAAENGRLPVLMLSPELEKLLSDNLVTGRAGGWALDGLSRGWCQRLEAEVREAFEAALHVDGVPPVLLCASELRGPLARLFAEAVPRLRTLAVNELSLESVEPVGAGVIDLSVHWGAWAA